METKDFKAKPCCVMLEPMTPKPQTSLSSELRNAIEERSLMTVRSKGKLLTDLKILDTQYSQAERDTRRNKVVAELLATEKSYIHQLKTIEKYFIKPIQTKHILSFDEHKILFEHVSNIRILNEELLQKMRLPGTLAEAFIDMYPYFRLYYLLYATSFKRSLALLSDGPTRRDDFFKFLELQESRPEVKQKLSALLIVPIQRVPRYCLLLKQILNNTDPSDSSYEPLQGALAKMQSVVELIDNLVGRHENAERLIKLQLYLKNRQPRIIKPGRELIKEGILKQLSVKKNSYKKKFFILTSDILMCCSILKHNINGPNSLKWKAIFPLNKCKVVELSNNCFKITSGDAVISLTHTDPIVCQQWIDTIKETIEKCLDHKRSLRKDSSSRRPAFGKHLNDYHEPGISPGIPRRKRQLDPSVETFSPAKIAKRNSINTDKNIDENLGTIQKIRLPDYVNQGQDSLYPLRQQLAQKSVAFAESSNENNPESNDVFVFGGNNQNRGFGFKLGSLFNGLSKSFKKYFGFRNN